MFRVFKVMAILVVLPLCLAVSAQPAYAVNGDNPVYQSGTEYPDIQPDDVVGTGGPEDDGEGDPDEVGGGYGATVSDGDLDGLFGGLNGHHIGGRTFEEFVYFMLQQFIPIP